MVGRSVGRKANVISHLGTHENGRVFADKLKHSRRIPTTETQMTIDPVCGIEVDEKNPEFQAQFAGKKYFFCSDECRKEFEQQPNEYIETAA